MPNTDETEQAEGRAAAPEEGEAPPPPPELPLEWAYREGGEAKDRGAADCVVLEDGLHFQCRSGPPFDIRYADIESVEDSGVNLLLALRGGGALELSKMGRLRDMFRGELMARWTKLNRRQALAEEALLASFTGKACSGDGAPRPAGIGVYTTAVVLDFESGDVRRIPLVFSGRPREEGYAFVFALPGERWTVSHLGRETDRFRDTVEQAMNALEAGALQRLRTLCPDMPPFKARGAVGKFLDGLAVPVASAKAAWPALEAALAAELEAAGLAESWKAALELGRGDLARVGRKTALKSAGDVYRWFFVPVVREGSAAVVMEASGEGGGGKATYVFGVPGGPDAAEAAMDGLNYALVMVNFRREPIYMSEAQMRKPGNEHYLRSVERVPALAELRKNFLGRVAHTTPEAWRRGLEELLGKI